MDATESAGSESELARVLGKVRQRFRRSEPREQLRTYVSGELGEVERKRVEHNGRR